MKDIEKRLRRAEAAVPAPERGSSVLDALIRDVIALTSDEDAEHLRSRVQERRKDLAHLPILERWRAYWPEWFDRMAAECGPLFDHHGVPRAITGGTHAG